MATDTTNTNDTNGKIQLETGTYEIIRKRLDKYGDELRDRTNQLNEERRKVFGSADASLIATERIITENACIPVDMEPIGNQFIFGYNVNVKLRETEVDDVFSVYAYQDHSFKKQPLDLINNETFINDFKSLYKYFDKARFVKFSVIGTGLFMVFSTGDKSSDIKVFKWHIVEDQLAYVDNRSELEFQFPKQHEFKWKSTNRDMFVEGTHPHVNIENILFVETVGGDLTIKAENNTEDGSGVYEENVEVADQTLDDAEIYYSVLDNIIILKIRPYQENDFRYIVYSSKTKSAVRIDAIANACVLLPDNQGIIFSNGYYLQTGDYKFYDNQFDNLIFEKRIDSPNGEDYLYTFYEQGTGAYVLLKYNLIEQEIETPIVCNGFSIFENGEMCNFRDDGEAKKHHVVQIWKTTFFHADYDTVVDKKSYLFKIGNKALVKGIAECREVNNLLKKDDSYTNLYLELVKKTTSIIDGYYWISRPDTFNINEPLLSVKEAAASAIDEFEKVSKIKKSTAEETGKVLNAADELFDNIHRQNFENIDEFVVYLTEIRKLRGELISLKDLRYVKIEKVEEYEEKAKTENDKLSEACIAHLVKEESLIPYAKKVDEIRKKTQKIKKVTEANEIEAEIMQVSAELEMLIEIVSNLKIKDAVQTAKIIDNISAIYSGFNKIKAELKRRRDDLFLVEGRAEFSSQIKLISQAVINYLDLCDTPEKTDEYLTKLLVQLEELEGKFSEFDEFINEISLKREEIHDAFEQRKIQLNEKRSKRADTLQQSAERILKAVSSRISKLKSETEINGYFAADIMIEKVRDIVSELIELDESVKADEIQSRLKTTKEDAVRQLRDKSELFLEGENIIRFGNQAFTVNTQNLGLTMVNRSGKMYFHLSGTGFYEAVDNPQFNQLQAFWNQSIVSENEKVYRGEYLAYKFLTEKIKENGSYFTKGGKVNIKKLSEDIYSYMSVRYSEGYVKGIHDNDALKLLEALLTIRQKADLLRYSSPARACAEMWYNRHIDEAQRKELNAQIKASGIVLETFPSKADFKKLIAAIRTQMIEYTETTGLFDSELADEAAEYLFFEMARGDSFIISSNAAYLYKEFTNFLRMNNLIKRFRESLKDIHNQQSKAFDLIISWLEAFIAAKELFEYKTYTEETAVTLLTDSMADKKEIDLTLRTELNGMEGSHDLIDGQKYLLDYNDFMRKLHYFENYTVVGFKQFVALKKSLTDEFEADLRLNEFKPRVMSSFVRNKLINNVYLPLIGNNLAKQIGTAGEDKRTDLMGMLLLISPPGYGKTTLMEYIANRLGIIFMKINGPALGHSVISVDPTEAPNATAREELEKLNLAFEIGDNVMIYLDDIQHCNAEFLQKFISLADAQRKIEGVYKGKTKTYDFRGKKVCIIMAGNPYTESGDRFQIPDMLANRADIYNLGDILGDSENEFMLSYIENSLTSNKVLRKLAGKSRKDVYTLIESIESGVKERLEYESNHSAEDLKEYTSVIEKLLTIRGVVSRVNREYIDSAAQADLYRTEPPFKLQGSYRDMNKLAEQVMPVMNDKELETLLLMHYENESQTLTSDAEANFLKFKKITGKLSKEEAERYAAITEMYLKDKSKDSDNQIALLSTQVGSVAQGLLSIKEAIEGKK